MKQSAADITEKSARYRSVTQVTESRLRVHQRLVIAVTTAGQLPNLVMVTTVPCAKTRSASEQLLKHVNSTEQRKKIAAMRHKSDMTLIKRFCASLRNKQNIR